MTQTERWARVIAVVLLAIVLLELRSAALLQAVRTNRLAVAVLHAALNDHHPAVPAAVLAANPETPATHQMLGMLALGQGNMEVADEQFAAAIAGDASQLSVIRAARPHAMTLAQLAYHLYPEDPVAAAWLGDTLAATQPRQALAAYQVAVQHNPGDNLTWEQMGALAQSQGDLPLARTAYQSACDLNTIRNGACESAAELAYAAGDWEQTIHYFVRASMPERAEDWVRLIRAAQHLGRAADANAYLAQAQQRNPADYATLLAK